MYKISVPIILANHRFDRYYKRYIEMCKAAGVNRVFLCTTTWTAPEEEKQRCIDLLHKYIPIFRAEGFEVGTWINSLGHGGTCGDFVNEDISDGLQRMVGLDGKMNMGAYCPLCENLQALATDWIRRLGQTDLDLIMMGTTNTPVFDYQTGEFSSQAKVSYEHVVNEHQDTTLAWALREYFAYLEKIDYAMNYKDSMKSKLFFDTCYGIRVAAEKRVFEQNVQ